MKAYETKVKQMELLMVKEEERHVPAKRVDIVSLRLVISGTCAQHYSDYSLQLHIYEQEIR